MAGKISSFSSGIQGGPERGTSSLTTNTRVKTTTGHVGLITDVVLFGGGTGAWFLSNQRVRVNGAPTIGASSVGVYTPTQPGPPPATMVVADADARGKGM